MLAGIGLKDSPFLCGSGFLSVPCENPSVMAITTPRYGPFRTGGFQRRWSDGSFVLAGSFFVQRLFPFPFVGFLNPDIGISPILTGDGFFPVMMGLFSSRNPSGVRGLAEISFFPRSGCPCAAFLRVNTQSLEGDSGRKSAPPPPFNPEQETGVCWWGGGFFFFFFFFFFFLGCSFSRRASFSWLYTAHSRCGSFPFLAGARMGCFFLPTQASLMAQGHRFGSAARPPRGDHPFPSVSLFVTKWWFFSPLLWS